MLGLRGGGGVEEGGGQEREARRRTGATGQMWEGSMRWRYEQEVFYCGYGSFCELKSSNEQNEMETLYSCNVTIFKLRCNK